MDCKINKSMKALQRPVYKLVQKVFAAIVHAMAINYDTKGLLQQSEKLTCFILRKKSMNQIVLGHSMIPNSLHLHAELSAQR